MSSARPESQASAPWDVNVTRLSTNVLIACLTVEVALVALDYFVNYGRLTEIGALRRMFNMAREDGLASWFAATQTLLVGLTLALVYLVTKRSESPRWKGKGWLALALLFAYMAVDDGAQVHERLGTAFDRMTESSGVLDFFPSYTWQVVFLPFFGAAGLFMLWFLWRELPRKSARRTLLLAMSFFALAVGLDFVEGLDRDHPWNVLAWLARTFDWDAWSEARFEATGYEALQHFSRSIEEALEMAATSVLWFLFVRRLGADGGGLHVRFREG